MTDRTGRGPFVSTKCVIKLKLIFTLGRGASEESEEYCKIKFDVFIEAKLMSTMIINN